MRSTTCIIVLALTVLGLACLVTLNCDANPMLMPQINKASTVEQDKHESVVPKLFDFENYKSVFKKEYKSVLEELNRKQLFFSSAFRAFISGMRYKNYESNYYESVNLFSDQTEEELDKMTNKLRMGDLYANRITDSNRKTSNINTEFLLPNKNEDVEKELESLVERHASDPAYEELRELFQKAAKSGKERELSNGGEPRVFPQLINIGQNNKGPKATKKINNRPASNNLLYKRPELKSSGSKDLQERMIWWKMPESNDSQNAVKNFETYMDNIAQSKSSRLQSSRTTNLPDEVFFDHRDSGCLFMPRYQQRCGSSYAFSAVAVMEWLHCIKTGELTAFSEQYLIDCGKHRYRNDMDGCTGGRDRAVGEFIHDFGMELRVNYPYIGKEQQCPYDEHVNLDKTGYIRMELNDGMFIPQFKWNALIEHQPLLIGINSPKDFSKYGGGVFDDADLCSPYEDHSVVLVGHGREDGIDYWLIRNSYTAAWGEWGYMKIAKSAGEKCLSKEAVALGTDESRSSPVKKLGNGKYYEEKLRAYVLNNFDST